MQLYEDDAELVSQLEGWRLIVSGVGKCRQVCNFDSAFTAFDRLQNLEMTWASACAVAWESVHRKVSIDVHCRGLFK